MIEFISKAVRWLTGTFGIVYASLFAVLMLALTDLGNGLVLWVIDIGISVVNYAFNQFSAPDEVMNIQTVINSIPVPLQQIMHTMQIHRVFFILGNALLIRLGLRFIPFFGR
jgi:hypothetical protein